MNIARLHDTLSYKTTAVRRSDQNGDRSVRICLMTRGEPHKTPHNRYRQALDEPEQSLTDRQRRWLQPRRVSSTITYTLLYLINLAVMRFLFRVSVEGRGHLPVSGPFIVMPNHSSPFDPPILAVALPLRTLLNTFWAGKRSTVLHNRLRVLLSWLTRVIPIHDQASALAAGVTILEQGNNLVWFPEGRRSTDGQLQAFKPGIAMLLTRCDVPVVPVYIDGAYQAFPTGARFPRWRARIVVRIGEPEPSPQPGPPSLANNADVELVVENLRQQVVRLRDS
jgi:long-chain acyl-CoA synthetase